MAKVNVRQILSNAAHPDGIGRNKAGNLVLRWGYYYRTQAGRMETHKANVALAMRQAGIPFEFVGDGDHFAAFRGGAPLARQSHTWLEIKVLDVVVPDDLHDAAEN